MHPCRTRYESLLAFGSLVVPTYAMQTIAHNSNSMLKAALVLWLTNLRIFLNMSRVKALHVTWHFMKFSN